MSDQKNASSLIEFVSLVIEGKVREIDISNGRKVQFGSYLHVADLEKRIGELSSWRNKQKRGSEARATYARLIQKLKNELTAAKRVAAKAPAMSWGT